MRPNQKTFFQSKLYRCHTFATFSGNGSMQGSMKYMKLLWKTGADIWWLIKCTNLDATLARQVQIICCTIWPYDLVVCGVGLLQSLNMNTTEFTLSQLQEHKLCVTSEFHVDVVVLFVWVVFVCLVVWYVKSFWCYQTKIRFVCVVIAVWARMIQLLGCFRCIWYAWEFCYQS